MGTSPQASLDLFMLVKVPVCVRALVREKLSPVLASSARLVALGLPLTAGKPSRALPQCVHIHTEPGAHGFRPTTSWLASWASVS